MLLTTIIEQLPRHKRRFPFRAENSAEQKTVNLEAGEIIAEIDPLLRKMVRSRMPRGADTADIEQQVRIAIWLKLLPRFDAQRGVKPTTFVIGCLPDLITDELRKVSNHPTQTHAMPFEVEAPDESLDTAIEQLAEAIQAEPERFFSRSDTKVVRRLLRGESPTAIARSLEIDPGPLWDLTYKLRRKIREIAPAKVA